MQNYSAEIWEREEPLEVSSALKNVFILRKEGMSKG